MADQVADPAHLNAGDTTYARVSRAPQEDIARLKARMGWQGIPWYTLTDDFDADFGVEEWARDERLLPRGRQDPRTYFVNDRGDEALGSTWSDMDLTVPAARRSGRTRRRATRRPARMSGGGVTTRRVGAPTRGKDASTRKAAATREYVRRLGRRT